MNRKTLAILISCIITVVYSKAQTSINIAPTASGVTASYTAAWNSLPSIKNGTVGYGLAGGGTPQLGNSETWGSWSSTRPASQWLQYDWAQAYDINQVTVYFWADNATLTGSGAGVSIPASWTIQYWNALTSAWADVALAEGQSYPLNIALPNTVQFASVNTTKLRLNMNAQSNGTTYAALGVTEWQAYAVISDPVITTGKSLVVLDDTGNMQATVNVKGSNITAAGITLSTSMNGVSLSTQQISQADANAENGVDVVLTFNPAAGATASGTLLLTCGTVTKQVNILTSKELDCFAAVSNNVIGDPRFLSLGNLSTWGTVPTIVSLLDNITPYCGATCVKLAGAESGLEMRNNINFEAGEYKTSGFVKSNGTLQVGAYSNTTGNFAAVDATLVIDNNKTNYINFRIPNTNGEWAYFEYSFTIGNSVTGGAFINNGAGSNATEAFLDNWQFYRVGGLTTGMANTDSSALKLIPVKGGLKIQGNKAIVICIFALNGQMIQQVHFKGGETLLHLNKGMYLVEGKKIVIK